MNKIKRNIIFNVLLQISTIIFPLITFPYISRVLLPSGTGKISFVISVINYFVMFSMLGIPIYGIRECAKVREDKGKLSKLVEELMVINSILLILVYAIYFAMIIYVNQFHSYQQLFVVMGSSMLLNAMGVEWLYKAMEEYDYIAIRTVAFKIVGLILMFVFVHTENDYVKYGAIVTAAGYGSYILNFVRLRKYIAFRNYGRLQLQKHFKPILVFFATSVAVSIYTNLDIIMLGLISGDEMVGYFNAAIKIKGILAAVLSAPAAVLLPSMTRYIRDKQYKLFLEISKKVINLITLVSVPATLFSIIVAPEIIRIISGSEYDNAIPIMRIVSPTLIFISYTGVLGTQMLNPLGRESKIFVSVFMAAIIDFLMNLMLIPLLGGKGTAISTVIAELVVCIIQVYYLNKYEVNPFDLKYFLKILCLSGVCSVVIVILKSYISLKHQIINLVIYFIVFSSIYLLELVIVKDKNLKYLFRR